LNFKKLEVSGFKSFADKLQVSFSDGITAIVGPNGCGKSNVADSIRWVLGEQSAKLLRGSSMQDVIFNGTERRKSLSYAEVSLFFDNFDRTIPIDYNEVVISRKLYRSGESEYFINNNLSRLKDIVALLRDAGMGREGYSIIGQGRIESLLSAKPEDRRAIFEEAAGISKHKAQKRESELKLERTSDNLSRLVDIRDEKARYLEPLSRQAENAKLYLDYKEQLKNLEINIYLHNFESSDKAKQSVMGRLQKTEEQLGIANAEYEATNKEFESILVKGAEMDATQQETNQKLLGVSVELEKRSSDVRVVKEKQASIEQTIARLQDEQQSAMQMLEENENESIALGTSIASLTQKLSVQRAAVDTIGQEYIQLVEELTAYEQESNQGQDNLINAYDKLSQIKANASRLLAERDGLTIKKSELEQSKESTAQAIEEYNQELKNQVQTRDALREHLDAMQVSLASCEQKTREYTASLSKLSNQKQQAQSEQHIYAAKLKLAKDIKESHEGFVYAVKKLLGDAAHNATLSGLIKGVVGKVISVEPKYELAIETALGAAIQNIIVQEEQDAKQLIEYLRQKQYGRATFLPLSSIKPRSIDRQYFDILKQNGVCGIASDLVKCEGELQKAIKSLLGSTVLVDNLDTGIAISKQSGYSFKVVSLQGDVLATSGAITGGQKRESGNTHILGKDREFLECEQRLLEINQELSELGAKYDEAYLLQSSALQEIEQLSQDTKSVEIRLAQNAQKMEALTDIIQEQESRLGQSTMELVGVHARLVSITSDIGLIEQQESDFDKDKSTVNESLQKGRSRYATLASQRDECNAKMHECSIGIATTESELKSTNAMLVSMRTQKEGLVQRIDKLRVEIALQQNLVEGYMRDAESILQGLQENAQLQAYKAQIEYLQEQKAALVEAQIALESRRNECIEQIKKHTEQKSKEELQLLKVDTDIENMGNKIFEEYGLSFEQCTEMRAEIGITAATTEARKLRSAISGLGNINLDAIEESQSLFVDYNQYCTQIDDLERARADLQSIIANLNKEMSTTFATEFEKIRTNFVKIFRELFNGGTADLVLQTDPSMTEHELLEAGIDIVAQPPEKKLQSISLLSGGERALTAIAILFAILRLKPMPFCVLDEIEAALDDANAHRFAKYLHKFSQETQFIVITHRKPTMELADSLYGVTMEEKGVSKIVSVKLSDAQRLADSGENSGVVATA